MANYNVDIDVKVKAGQLTNFNRVLDKTNERIDAVNKNIRRFASLSPKHIKPVTQSFNDLTMMVNKANTAFNKSTLGTPQAADAARNLVRANEQFNIGLEKRAKLLQQVTLEMKNQKLAEKGIKPKTMFSSPIGPGQAASAFEGRIRANIARSQEIREIAAAGSNRAGLGGGFKEFNKNAKKIQADTKKIRTIVAQNQVQGIQAFGNQQFAQPIGPVRPGPLGRLGIGTGANPRGIFANSRGRAGRISGGLSNALIGGGFPLLFGQGALGAAGGGIGGAIGGALGGPFGFGLSIAGTAIAQRVQETIDFQKSVDKLNISIKAAGGSSFFTAKGISQLGKQLGISKQEALKAAQSFAAFDANVRKSLLITFGDEATFNLVKGLKTNVQLLDDIKAAEDKIGIAKADQLRDALRTEGSLKVQKRLQEAIIESVKKQQIGNKDKVNFFDRFKSSVFNNAASFSISPQITTPSKLRDERVDSLQKIEERTEGVRQLDLALERALGEKLTKNIAMVRDELEALVDPINRLTSLADTVGSAFAESFKGIVSGSMTAQEALRNLFQRTADHFLDMAAQILAAQVRAGIMGIFSNMFGGVLGGGRTKTAAITGLFGGGFMQGPQGGFFDSFTGKGISGPNFNLPLADGGIAKAGRTHLVGERGPELFTPGVTGTVTPNHALGGSTNIVVNVDASGSSVEGDEERGREFGEQLVSAVQAVIINERRSGGLLN